MSEILIFSMVGLCFFLMLFMFVILRRDLVTRAFRKVSRSASWFGRSVQPEDSGMVCPVCGKVVKADEDFEVSPDGQLVHIKCASVGLRNDGLEKEGEASLEPHV
mmetsp:Transcript_60132/g.113419  ORF Transcript_60132/g.113419 Transcript_60132/m.113419 type:complete len:105 (-) Transcript_60132:233-547(-)